MTKIEKFEAVAAILAEADNAELTEFIQNEIAILQRRASKPRGLTATQKENLAIKEDLYEIIAVAEKPVTAGEIAEVSGYSVQKVSALLRQMVADEAVAREMQGRAAFFSAKQ